MSPAYSASKSISWFLFPSPPSSLGPVWNSF
uniref:Uncharacterized protein n=1 Tax=Arundo donax TaxID=35708 RepID=A0A0A9FIM0_ARUDO